MTQHEPTHSRGAIIADLACIIGEMADLQAEQARLSERQAAMQSRLGKMIRDLSTTTAVIRAPLTPQAKAELQRAIRSAPAGTLQAEPAGTVCSVAEHLALITDAELQVEMNRRFLIRSSGKADAASPAKDATPAGLPPAAQDEGQPVKVGRASDVVPERGVGSCAQTGQSEELRHDAGAGGESAASADTAPAPDERKKRRRLPSSAEVLAKGAKYRNSEMPPDPIVAAARPPSVQTDGGGLVQDGGSTGETRGDQMLNLWAETTLSQDEIAAKLKVNSGTPSAYLSTARRQLDPRAVKGDLARAALRPPRHEIPDGRPALINLETGQITGAAGSWTADRAVAKAINVLADGQLYDTSRMAKVSGIKEDAIVASMGIWASALAKIGVELRYQRGYGCRLLAIRSEAA